jgi:hypothetical protein
MLQNLISGPWFIIGWAALMLPCLVWVIRDLLTRNDHLMPLMKVVWIFTVFYSGPFGLMVYLYSGRKEIRRDSLWRKSFRSVAHCYSGCGMGEIVGIFITVGLLSLGNIWVAGVTFVLAYVAGYSLTVGPLMQEGVSFRAATKDAFLAETPSIAVMEMVAIASDLLLAGNAGMGDYRFWSSLVVSLTLGLVAAYPVNVLLIHFGVKEGMMNPRNTEHP